jgi:hypothetical protein
MDMDARENKARIFLSYVEDPNNKKDISDYITKRLVEPELRAAAKKFGKPKKQVQHLLLKVGAGNFLIVTQVLEALAHNQRTSSLSRNCLLDWAVCMRSSSTGCTARPKSISVPRGRR